LFSLFVKEISSGRKLACDKNNSGAAKVLIPTSTSTRTGGSRSDCILVLDFGAHQTKWN